MEITWDEAKNLKNRKKHKVWFEDAQRVFDDPNHRVFFDDKSSTVDEERFLVIGFTDTRVLIVSYAEYVNENMIRIISARKANKKEENYYYER